MKRVVILNPKSRHGKAAKAFSKQRAEWTALLGDFEVYETKAPGDATKKVRELLAQGEVAQILVAGGDGSVNEASQGYWSEGKISRSDVPMGIINLGTGGDFYRTVTELSADYRAALAENRSSRIDSATVTCGTREPVPFLNISSVGMAGEMNANLKASRFQSGAAAYFYHTLTTLIRFTPREIEIEWEAADGEITKWERELINLFVCNGQFSGGGMQWAPGAALDDGLLRVTVISGTKKLPLILQSGKVYGGKIEEYPGAEICTVKSLTIRSAQPVSVEADGEVLAESCGGGIRYRVLPQVFPLVR